LRKEEAEKMYKRAGGTPWYTSDNVFDERFFRFPAELRR